MSRSSYYNKKNIVIQRDATTSSDGQYGFSYLYFQTLYLTTLDLVSRCGLVYVIFVALHISLTYIVYVWIIIIITYLECITLFSKIVVHWTFLPLSIYLPSNNALLPKLLIRLVKCEKSWVCHAIFTLRLRSSIVVYIIYLCS